MTEPARSLNTLGSLGLDAKTLSTHEFQGGCLVWLRVMPTAHDLGGTRLARDLVIEETGVVALLRVRNPAAHDILIPSDLMLDGGKQARVVERSVIVPAHGDIDLPVRCVEAGRWKARDASTAQTFTVSPSASTDSREHFTQLRQRSYHARASYDLDQSEVWTHVASELRRHDVDSETTSYTAILARRERQLEHARQLEVHAPREANGVAVVRHLGATWIEAFPSSDYVETMVPSFVADLLEGAPCDDSWNCATSRLDAAIRKLRAAELITVPTPRGTGGQSFAVDADGVAGSLLLHDGRLAHLATRVA